MSDRLFERTAAGLGTAAVTAAIADLIGPVVDRLPGGTERFARTNHRGEPVTLLEGPVAVLGTAAGLLLTPDLPRNVRFAGLIATLGGGAFGALDDLAGSGSDRGLRGHLRALRQGKITTGAVKIIGLGATGWVSARVAGQRGLDGLVSAALIAGVANFVNLLDLRPGRALKVVLLHTPSLVRPDAAYGLLAAPIGAAAAALPDDLGERSMLGDTGANGLGAIVGLAAVATTGRWGRWLDLAGVAALTLASERISFTEVIARTPPLRVLDELGRRPAEPGRPTPSDG